MSARRPLAKKLSPGIEVAALNVPRLGAKQSFDPGQWNSRKLSEWAYSITAKGGCQQAELPHAHVLRVAGTAHFSKDMECCNVATIDYP